MTGEDVVTQDEPGNTFYIMYEVLRDVGVVAKVLRALRI